MVAWLVLMFGGIGIGWWLRGPGPDRLVRRLTHPRPWPQPTAPARSHVRARPRAPFDQESA